MASSSSLWPFPTPPSLTPVMKEDGECINWAELPSELTSSILRRLSSIDILENAQKVCTSWRFFYKDRHKHVAMCRHAVDRSLGGLVEIDICYIGTDSLLNYIADRFISPSVSK
ncbi:unnamed protein product, partial [Brassica oleracea var. botrytis]